MNPDVNPDNGATSTVSALPLVTVVVPVYNRLQYVGAAIESILTQTYANIEIIVVDDGSKVSVEEALEPYANRIRFYRQPNGGPSSARNYGLDHARGTYILFLDHDDILEPHAIETLVVALTGEPGAVWAAGKYIYMDEAGQRLPQQPRCHYESGDIYAGLIYENLLGAPCTVLLNVEVARAAGGFDEAYRFNEDYDLWFRLSRDHPIIAVQDVVAVYRVHGEQVTNSSWAKLYEYHFDVLHKNLAQARPGYEVAFANSAARCHLEFGDDWYVRDEAAKARDHWRQALSANPGVTKTKILIRYVKSYLPHKLLSTLRRTARHAHSDTDNTGLPASNK